MVRASCNKNVPAVLHLHG